MIKHVKDIIKIANINGYEQCVDLLIEEMAELTQALLKEKRVRNLAVDKKDPIRSSIENGFATYQAKTNVEEEVSDVYITLHELLTFINCTNVESIIDFKIERALENESKL